MRHCNSVFKAQDVWFLIDNQTESKRKLYIANCPICNKEMALYSYYSDDNYFEKYYYSNGARKIKERFKKDIAATMLSFKNNFKMPNGFKYGKNVEIKHNGKIVEIRQYACDFSGNKILVKRIRNEN